MSCGFLHCGGATPLPLRSRPPLIGVGAGSPMWVPPNRTFFRPVSFKFRARAAVEEGGRIGASSFYELLGIPESGSLEEIKRAYKRMARKYHPDVSPPDLAEEYTRRFIEVQEAYETLSDPGRRAVYDRDLARGLQFALSSRRRFDQELKEKSRWKNRWEDQLDQLKRRSACKDSSENLSWGARMRRQRTESSTE